MDFCFSVNTCFVTKKMNKTWIFAKKLNVYILSPLSFYSSETPKGLTDLLNVTKCCFEYSSMGVLT